MEIKFNKIGLILNGNSSYKYIKIIDDHSNTGGFLIITSEKEDMSNGFDDWVEIMKF